MEKAIILIYVLSMDLRINNDYSHIGVVYGSQNKQRLFSYTCCQWISEQTAIILIYVLSMDLRTNSDYSHIRVVNGSQNKQ